MTTSITWDDIQVEKQKQKKRFPGSCTVLPSCFINAVLHAAGNNFRARRFDHSNFYLGCVASVSHLTVVSPVHSGAESNFRTKQVY